MARAGRRTTAAPIQLDQAFFEYLWLFYRANRSIIRRSYKELTRRFLDFNDPAKRPETFLRIPQFEALEIYVFLKEYTGNAHVAEVFNRWYYKRDGFENRAEVGLTTDAQTTMLPIAGMLNEGAYRNLYERVHALGGIDPKSLEPPNYIYALTMGTGKTILMATCILYEFLLANKYPEDPRYAHNAVVFAPDTTVLESLREIETFDHRLVLPEHYANVLTPELKFHVLSDSQMSLAALEHSRFNIVISNAQKIILKRQRTLLDAGQILFSGKKATYEPTGAYVRAADAYNFDALDGEEDLVPNQRFHKLCRLKQLGIYIDEAHHAFGAKLAQDLGQDPAKETSFRITVRELIGQLRMANTRVVATHCYTGTPYADGKIFPDVVYAYGLKKAIDNALLKKLEVVTYGNAEPKSGEFVRLVIDEFLKHVGKNKRYEGMLPKLAIFGAEIEEVQNELRPAVERHLQKLGIPLSRVLVNVGDSRYTTDDDIREFNRLDHARSEKQFILLVNKGKEGWNCRSLFGVALYRRPKSKIFVLQATMRCLRAIDAPNQHTGIVFVSDENRAILDNELEQNFRVSLDDVRAAGSKKVQVEIRPVPPPRHIKLRRIHHRWNLRERKPGPGIAFEFEKVPLDRYKLTKTVELGVIAAGGKLEPVSHEDITHLREQRRFTELSLVAECARYLNRGPLQIEDTLVASREGIRKVIEWVNRYNGLLYDHVIPSLFRSFYDIESKTETEEVDVTLVKESEEGHYRVMAEPDKIVARDATDISAYAHKSFHLDHYCFDSNPEKTLFFDLLKHGRVKQIYFTGMLTHGQTDFFIDYIDPETNAVRSYYPDFVVQTTDGHWLIVEVKGDDMLDDATVQAKRRYAEEVAGDMRYELVAASKINQGKAPEVLGKALAWPG